ncbi:MAG TPA: endonuclease/exonuclease/phosphatase family protein [Patescibacteria group bacterium]|nr:endonuclease/exonuclease/phosphatase family protein [Patescibacteria group bacterium]
MKKETIRIATYNVHKCRGMDGRVRPERIAEVLGEIDADIVALQEVISTPDSRGHEDQAGFLAHETGLKFVLGETRRRGGRPYGNLLLSRFPIRAVANYDISAPGREPRCCLRADLGLDRNNLLHVFNVHLGTSFFERRHQARRLIGPSILGHPWLNGPRIVLGDFNEWTRGLATRLLAARMATVDIESHLGRKHTYPGILPVLNLDHIYFDRHLEVRMVELHRTSTALVASDHLPLVAELKLLSGADGNGHTAPPDRTRHTA